MAPTKKFSAVKKQVKVKKEPRTKKVVKKDRRKRKEKEPKPAKVKKERKNEKYIDRKFRERISRSGMKAGSLFNYFQMTKIVKGEAKNESDENSQPIPLPLSKLPQDIESESATANNLNEEISINPEPEFDHEQEWEYQELDINETNIHDYLQIEIGETYSSYSRPSYTRTETDTREEIDFDSEYDPDFIKKEDQLSSNNENITSAKSEDNENYSQDDDKYMVRIAKNIFEDSISQQVIKEEDNKRSMKSKKKNILFSNIHQNYE